MPKGETVRGEWGSLPTDGQSSAEQIEGQAQVLLAQMSLAEKVAQMSGDIPLFSRETLRMLTAYNSRPFPAGENPRLGIPGIRFSDGPRGVVMYHSTCFPVSMGRGATWDAALEERIGDAIGVEARSQGANFYGGVCINLLRHPAWGRAQETYGEDPHHLGEMGAALVRGVQRHIMACVKHYALNSMENARFSVDVQVNERALREVYLPHFKRCIDEGAAAVMSAYNKVRGRHCGHSAHLLRDILKREWGFSGFVMSDFILGIRSARGAALAGLDVEMPFRMHYRRNLAKLVRSGEVPEALVDEAVLRILRQKIRFAGTGERERYGPHEVVSAAHRAMAREAAQKSMVLLKNDPVGDAGPLLPLNTAQPGRIALIGRLATVRNIGDHGSSMVRPPHVVTPLEGLQAAFGTIVFEKGRDIAAAAMAARTADTAVVIAGYTHRNEGEYIPLKGGGDRASLTLERHDEDLIKAVAEANPKTVVVLMGGSAIITESWREKVPAIVMAWYPGMEGGHALADILSGAVNPSGRLPCVFPRSENQLPFFDRKARSITYDAWHGYRLMDRQGFDPAFAFGFGLSYTTFAYRGLHIIQDELDAGDTLQVSVEVTNTGRRSSGR
ncbi:MAG: glycoside hydrolase family 3 C-terminal domain-containing protein [Desulfobacterota bacterium]|nr:glycoside hydrolase family 3 C-terminal domain-containing protein [Thermodesulfobacteriota bacterium]